MTNVPSPFAASSQPTAPRAAARPVVEQYRADGCLSYLLIDPASREAAVIDPRLDQVDTLLARLREGSLVLRHVLETHTHADHLSGAARLRRETGAEVAMSEGSDSLVATRRLHDGDRIALGAFEIAVLATPGHTSDSLSFRTDGALFTGDSLLIGGSGRCDFVGGSPSQLYRSFEALRALPNETTVYPGHDYRGRTHTTIADERAANPLFGERDERAFVARFAASRPQEPANMRLVLEANKTGAPAGVGRIGAPALKQRLDAGERLTLLDVRSPAEHEGSRLHGSLNVPLEKLGSSLASVPSSAPIVIVCATGTRSSLAAPALRDRAGVLVLEGGLDAWRKCGFETEGGAPGVWPLERQVRLVAGLLVLLGSILALAAAPGFVGIAIFIGAGLTFSGLTGFCGMALLLGRLPWNRRAFAAAAAGGAPTTGGGCAMSSGGGCAA